MKKEWKQFGLKVAAWTGAALALQFLTTIFLGGPPPYIVPGLLALGALQIGLLDRTPLPGGGGTLLKRGVALLMITFAVWLGLGAAGLGTEQRIAWQVYSEELLNAARQGQRPVMIDFTSRNCPPCHDMERFVFSNRRVAEAARNFLALRMDLTDLTPSKQIVADKFGIKAFPTIVFLGGDGRERPNLRLEGYENASFFAQRLDRAR